MVVGYGVCVGSWEKLRRNVEPRVGGRQLFAMAGQTSITEAYNSILAGYCGRGLDALVLLHDDLEIIDPDGEAKFLAAIAEPGVALVGVAGGRGVGSLAWWNAETVGHQLIDTGLLDFGPRTGDVDALEGSILVFSPWAIEHLRFDTRFVGFHGYDEIAAQARAAGRRVVVADVDTHHHTSVGFKSPESAREWQRADALFRKKWGL